MQSRPSHTSQTRVDGGGAAQLCEEKLLLLGHRAVEQLAVNRVLGRCEFGDLHATCLALDQQKNVHARRPANGRADLPLFECEQRVLQLFGEITLIEPAEIAAAALVHDRRKVLGLQRRRARVCAVLSALATSVAVAVWGKPMNTCSA